MVIKKQLIIFLLLTIVFNASAQNILLDEISLMDQQRTLQLLKDSSQVSFNSFMIRSTSKFQYLQDLKKSSNKLRIGSFSFAYDQQNNSLLPESWNDGIMYPARGWQERYSLGANIRWGILDINVQPEWLRVQNIPQEPYYGNQQDGNFAAKYFGMVANNIDDFRQFGNIKIDTFTFGQSRIGISTTYIKAGVSNENIWWGPGKRNSIAFTNNAGGFKHIYIANNQPISTPFGHIEFETIIGVLDTTRYIDPDIGLLSGWKAGIANKNLSQRNVDAITINLQPKWIPNFWVGYSYVQQYYQGQFNEYGQTYNFFSKDKITQNFGSLMFRIALPKDHAEFYGDFGLPDVAPWPWKFFSNKSKSGFIIGADKKHPIGKKGNYFNLNIELAQLQNMDPRNIFFPGYPFYGAQINTSWYSNYYIKQGYTNNGQLLAASIGPGSNSQTLSLSFNNAYNKIGISYERIVHNNDFYYIAYFNGNYYVGNAYYNRYWVDINTTLFFQLMPIKNVIVGLSFMKTNALNYRWVRYDDGHPYDEPSSLSDKFNSQFKLSIKYLLHAVIK